MNKEYRILNFEFKQPNKSKKLIIRCSIFFLCLIFSSCSNPYKNSTQTAYPEKNIKIIPYSLPHTDKTIIYKTDITFYKNNFGGLLILKKIEENNYRIALTTQFGLKIFDFELNRGKLHVVSCIEQLNKKIIIKTFEDDFNLLLIQNKFETISELQNQESESRIWLLKSEKFNYYYKQKKSSNYIDSISKRKRNSEKISVGLCNYQNELPGEIKLNHSNIKLKMNLKLIQ